jgi:ActR/RegA family two-component response regulator
MDKYILIVDDEENVRISLLKRISRVGFNVIAASTIDEANEQIKIKEIDVAIIDLNFLGNDSYGGVKIVENVNKLQPSAKIIILTGYSDTTETRSKLSNIKYNIFLSKGAKGNYISNIVKELEKFEKEQTPKKCFVIMPFSNTQSCSEQDWTDIFNLLICPAVENSGFNYKCFRNNNHVGGIIKNVMKNLNEADLVIADLTDRNVNVFYELGVRHTLKTPTILLCQNLKEVPFDLHGYFCIEYNQKPAGVKKLAEDIKNAINEIENSKIKIIYSPVGEYLQLNT